MTSQWHKSIYGWIYIFHQRSCICFFRGSETKIGPDVCGHCFGWWLLVTGSLSAFHLLRSFLIPPPPQGPVSTYLVLPPALDLCWKFHIHPSLVLDCGMHSCTGQDCEWVPSCSYIYSSLGDLVKTKPTPENLEQLGVVKAGKSFSVFPTLGTARVHFSEGCLTTTSATKECRTCTSCASCTRLVSSYLLARCLRAAVFSLAH